MSKTGNGKASLDSGEAELSHSETSRINLKHMVLKSARFKVMIWLIVLIFNLIWYIRFARNPEGMSPQRHYRLFLLRNFVFFAISLPDLVAEYNDLRNRRHPSRIRALLAMLPMCIYALLVPTGNLLDISYVLRDRSCLEEINWLEIWND